MAKYMLERKEPKPIRAIGNTCTYGDISFTWSWETLKPRKSELQKYKEVYEDDPLFKIKPLPLGKTNSSQIYESFEELAGKYLRTQQVLKEIFELLEKHQPPWYLRKHYNLICELLE